MNRSARAFTLVEMLMVMVIIAIIASLIVGVAGYAVKASSAKKAGGEISAYAAACENFKTDNGTYPRNDGVTESETPPAPIDPRLNGDPQSKNFRDASLFLYQQLSGDADADGKGGDSVGTPAVPAKMYAEFKPTQLGWSTDKKTVLYLQDPYGNSYGYSTAGLRAEEIYRQKSRTEIKAKKDTSAGKDAEGMARETQLQGFNSTFDLWSTAGTTTDPPTDDVRKKWVKNW